MDNKQLFSVEKTSNNQLYLSSAGRIHKMGDHSPDMTALETGNIKINMEGG